jgi:hypothetical protein
VFSTGEAPFAVSRRWRFVLDAVDMIRSISAWIARKTASRIAQSRTPRVDQTVGSSTSGNAGA